MRTQRNPRGAGFTLIELLVVIAIIGILASIVLTSLSSARARGRDAQRISTLQQIVNLISLNDSGTPAPFTGCNFVLAHQDVLTCTGPFTFPFKDPAYANATSPGPCGTHPTAVCQFSISKIGGIPDPTTENWEVCSYLEVGSGSLGPGYVSVSSSTSTPFHTASGCL